MASVPGDIIIEVIVWKDGKRLAADFKALKKLDATTYPAAERLARETVTKARKSAGAYDHLRS